MYKSRYQKPFSFLFSVLLTFLSGFAQADETEIFFSGAGGAAVRPNVLLILDTSGSMQAIVPGTGKTRFQNMQEALIEIIRGMENVNVGLMRFTFREGGPVLFPMSYIDAYAADVVSEPSETTPAFNYRIAHGNHDGEQRNDNGEVRLNRTMLRIGTVPAGGGSASIDLRVNNTNNSAFQNTCTVEDTLELQLHSVGAGACAGQANSNGGFMGVRFTGVNIPQGSTINSAHIEFTVESRESPGSPGNIDIRAQTVDHAAAFTGGTSSDISTRYNTSTSPTVSWAAPDLPAGTTVQVTITNLVQAIVSRPGWTPGNAMAFVFRNNGTVRRDYHSFGSGSDIQRPRLVVNFTSPPSSAQTTRVGLHFPRVDVPQGVTILDATLTFTASGNTSGLANWEIRADNVDNSSALATTAGNFNRTLTGSATWSPPDFVADNRYTTGDFSNVVQSIVNRPGWCGGNAMTLFIDGTGLRGVHSFNSDPDLAPVLNIRYAATGGGCIRKTETAQIFVNTDDAEQDGASMDRSHGDLDLGEKIVGVRFQQVDVPRGATILSAHIDFVARGVSTAGAPPTVNIVGQAHDNAPAFSANNNDLSNRTPTAASVNWNLGNWNVNNATHTTPDLKTIVQQIVNRAGWVSGNSMVFLFSDAGTVTRKAWAREESGTRAARLRIAYETTPGAIGAKTVRQRLIEIVMDLTPTDWTPIVETLYEAAHYWRGDPVVYGKGRDNQAHTSISHPGSYCSAPGSCNGATVNSSSHPVTNQFGVYYPPGCSESNLRSFACRTQAIIGNPRYISPFNAEFTCAANYQVLLTDGIANQNEAQAAIRSEFGISSCQTRKSFDLNGDGDTLDAGEDLPIEVGEQCGIDLVRKMHTADQSAGIAGNQIVTTYTIGFNTASLAGADLYLRNMAREGGGRWFGSTDTAELVAVFNEIMTDIMSDPTAFVAPTIATNQFNQLLSRDEIYFGMFTPDLHQAWLGNLKKYRLCVDPDRNNDGTDECTFGEVLDAQLQPAIDPADNQFRTTAQSFWSAAPDGRETTEGGAGSRLDDYRTRIIYTEFKDDGSGGTTIAAPGTPLDGAGYKLTSTNWAHPSLARMRAAVCPVVSTASGSDCEKRMLFMLGKIVEPAATDPSSTTRWSVYDVLHSAPAVVTYGGVDNLDANGNPGTDGIIDTFFDKVLFGSNGGGLHMVNAKTGIEEWTFIPQDRMDLQRSLFSNTEGNHLYGIDLAPTVRIIDNNRNGKIEPGNGDKAYVYAGMRRGGDLLYALDITPAALITSDTTTIVPKFLWRIDGGTNTAMGNYTRMGQSWSQPAVAKIRTTTGSKNVLIFGGGYDPALDNPARFAADPNNSADDFLGNAIFIVDADTGQNLLTISGSASGAHITNAHMQYSIPASLTVFDSDGDGFDDRIYAADVGGQVWRVDLGKDIRATGGLDSAATDKTIVGRLAAISDNSATALPINQRRFYVRPTVVQVRDNIYSDAANGEFDYVIIGSGYRARPLNVDVDDRLYAFRDRTTGKMTGQTGVGNVQHQAAGYPAKSGGITGSPISHADAADLIDITTAPLDDGSHNVTRIRQSSGWYFDFATDPNSTNGEKVLAAVRVIAGTAFVTSYQPGDVSANPCVADVGASRLGNFNILTARAAIDWDGDGDIDTADRFKVGGAGIVSEGVPVYTERGVLIVHTVGAGIAVEEAMSGVPRFKTYWHDDI